MSDLSYTISFNSNTQGLDNAQNELDRLKVSLDDTAKSTQSFAQAVVNIGTGQKGLNNIRDLINSIEQAGGSVSNLRQRYEQLANSFDGLNTREQGQQVRRLREYFESLGDSMDEVVSNSRTLDNELAETGTQIQSLGKNAGTAQEKLHKTKQATEQLGSVTNTAHKGINALTTALGALGVGFGVKELAEVADAYNTLSARIAVAVGETGNVEQAMAGVQQVALETNSSLDATSKLFSKIHDVGKSMGLTQQQSLDLTKTINQAISLSGGSAQSAEASITQLSQALASGVLRGDEFNSINEQAPEIMKALANSLGVTTGELRKMAEEGKLSSQVVVNALQNQADVIAEKYAKFPTTISQALQNIKTQWQIVVGEFDAENGASAVVVKALQVIGDNLAWLKNIFDDVGDGVGWFSDKLSQVDDSTIDELKRTLSLAYDTVKDLAKSIGDMGETAWSAFKSMLDSINPVFTAFVNGEQEVSGLDTAIRALQLGMGMLSDGAKGLSIILNGLVGGLQFVASAMSAVQAKIASFLGFEEVAKQAEMASDRLFALGEQSLERANQQIMDFKSSVRQSLDDMKKTEQQKNAESVASHKQALADKTQAWQDFVLAERNFYAERQTLEEGLKLARKTGDDERIKHHLDALAKLDGAEQVSTKTRLDLEKQKHDAVLEYAQSVISANGGVIDEQLKAELSAQGFAVAMSDAGKVAVSSLYEVEKSSEQVGLSLKDSALNAAKGLGVDVKLALNEINSAFSANIEQAKQVADGYNELKQAGMDAGALVKASLDKLLEGAKSQKEIDEVRKLFVQFGKEGKLSTKQIEGGIDAINAKLAKTPNLLDETTRAFKELGIISKDEAKKQAQDQMQMFELVKNSGQASSEQLQEALEKVQKSIEASGNTSQKAWLDSQQSALGLSKAVDKATKSTKKLSDTYKDVSKNAKEAGQAVEKSNNTAKNSSEGLAGAIAKIVGGIKSQMNAMTSMGATSEQINQIFDRLGKEVGKTRRSLRQLGEYFDELDKLTKKTVKSMTDMDSAVTSATNSLSGQSMTMADLQKAQETLSRATAFSIGGLIKLDKTKLSALKEQIKQAQKQMDDFSRSAKTTMQDLDAELASLQGREADSQRIKQAQKLADLQAKMAEAVARGNSDEIAHYSKALSLQKQINDEQNRQSTQKMSEQAMTNFGQMDKASGKSTNLTAQDVINGWNARLEQAKNQAKIEAKQELMQEMIDASKRQTY